MSNVQPDGFLALPSTDSPSGNGAAVLLLHAWWGLNETMKAIGTRLAEAGYTVFAPDLYHGKIAETIAEAEALGGALDESHLQAKAEIAQAATYLKERAGQSGSGIAVIAFSLGAYYALQLAATEPETVRAVVLFYGAGPADFSKMNAAFLGHFAENDPYEPQANVEELEQSLKEAGRPVTFHTYPGTGHWFFEPDQKQAYNQEAAELAWKRTLEFLRQSFSS